MTIEPKSLDYLTESEIDTLQGRWVDQLLSADEGLHIQGSYVKAEYGEVDDVPVSLHYCAVGLFALVDTSDILGVEAGYFEPSVMGERILGHFRAGHVVKFNDDGGGMPTFREVAEVWKAGGFPDTDPDDETCTCEDCLVVQAELDGA